MIKVVGFCLRHPNLTHEEYAAAHAGYHVTVGRRMRNLVGYLHYSWTDTGFATAVPAAARNEPAGFYDLWDGFSELYFHTLDDYFHAFEPVRDRAGEGGLIEDSIRRAMSDDSRYLYDVVHQFATIEHVIVPTVHPELRPVIVQQWVKAAPGVAHEAMLERWLGEYGPLHRDLPGLLGYSVTTRTEEDVVHGFFSGTTSRFAFSDPAERAHEAFYAEWTSYAHLVIRSLADLQAFRLAHRAELERFESEMFGAVWYREVNETVGKIPYRSEP